MPFLLPLPAIRGKRTTWQRFPPRSAAGDPHGFDCPGHRTSRPLLIPSPSRTPGVPGQISHTDRQAVRPGKLALRGRRRERVMKLPGGPGRRPSRPAGCTRPGELFPVLAENLVRAGQVPRLGDDCISEIIGSRVLALRLLPSCPLLGCGPACRVFCAARAPAGSLIAIGWSQLSCAAWRMGWWFRIRRGE
jgi:hypothetical protein